MVTLRCGCTVTEEGTFLVGVRCTGCKECTTIAELHPFGTKRLER